jgi:hypothetical protein
MPWREIFHEQAASDFRQQGDAPGLDGAPPALGCVASLQGDHAAALAYLQEALELVEMRGIRPPLVQRCSTWLC